MKKYKSFEDLPENLVDKYRKMIISTKPMYYEPNPSFSEEELDKIVSDFIRLNNILWHGLPNHIAKLIAEELEECFQPEVFPEDKARELILFGYNEGVFNGKGEKLMDWEEFKEKYAGKQPMVNMRYDLHKKLILKGIIQADHNAVYLDDLFLIIRDLLKTRGFEHNKISKEDIVNELCKKWNKNSKEVLEIIRNIRLLQELTGCQIPLENRNQWQDEVKSIMITVEKRPDGNKQ